MDLASLDARLHRASRALLRAFALGILAVLSWLAYDTIMHAATDEARAWAVVALFGTGVGAGCLIAGGDLAALKPRRESDWYPIAVAVVLISIGAVMGGFMMFTVALLTKTLH
jgi:drug/metabolite transporter (DMT)-like permease